MNTPLLANGNGNGSLLANLSKYGIGSLIGAYLAWQLGSQLPLIKEDLQTVHSENQEIKAQHVMMSGGIDRMQRVLVSICLNSARTQDQILRCNQ